MSGVSVCLQNGSGAEQNSIEMLTGSVSVCLQNGSGAEHTELEKEREYVFQSAFKMAVVLNIGATLLLGKGFQSAFKMAVVLNLVSITS